MVGDIVLMSVPLSIPFIAARFSGYAFCAGLFIVATGVFAIWFNAAKMQMCADKIFVAEAAAAVKRTQFEAAAQLAVVPAAAQLTVVPID